MSQSGKASGVSPKEAFIATEKLGLIKTNEERSNL